MTSKSIASFLKISLLAVVPLSLVLVFRNCANLKRDNERLQKNQDILLHNGEVEIGQTASGKCSASVPSITLKSSDLKHKPDSLLAITVKDLKIKNSRVAAAASVPSSTKVDMVGVVATDSAIQHVTWSDPWVRLDGTVEGDSFKVHIESRDTLQMIVHRVPKKFLFFRFGTKAVRMEVVSQNPHTTLSYPRLLVFSK